MDKNIIKQQAGIFEKARNNLLAVLAFTAVNIVLTAFDAKVNFLFSASLPQFVFHLGKNFDLELGTDLFVKIGLTIAAVIIALYFVFWFLAKRQRIFILIALIFFGIDSIVLVYLIFNIEFDFSVLMEIAFHIWILYYLINGTRAWAKLRGISYEEYQVILQEIKSGKSGNTAENTDNKSEDDKAEEENKLNN